MAKYIAFALLGLAAFFALSGVGLIYLAIFDVGALPAADLAFFHLILTIVFGLGGAATLDIFN